MCEPMSFRNKPSQLCPTPPVSPSRKLQAAAKSRTTDVDVFLEVWLGKPHQLTVERMGIIPTPPGNKTSKNLDQPKRESQLDADQDSSMFKSSL